MINSFGFSACLIDFFHCNYFQKPNNNFGCNQTVCRCYATVPQAYSDSFSQFCYFKVFPRWASRALGVFFLPPGVNNILQWFYDSFLWFAMFSISSTAFREYTTTELNLSTSYKKFYGSNFVVVIRPPCSAFFLIASWWRYAFIQINRAPFMCIYCTYQPQFSATTVHFFAGIQKFYGNIWGW